MVRQKWGTIEGLRRPSREHPEEVQRSKRSARIDEIMKETMKKISMERARWVFEFF